MIKKDTIIRLVVLILVLINQVLCSKGIIEFEFDENNIYELVSTIATILISLWSAWKNNSFTKNAIRADEYLADLRKISKEAKKND